MAADHNQRAESAMLYSGMPGRPFPGLILVFAAACAVTFVGCSKSSGRAMIAGNVSFKNGEPIKRGSIEFSPMDGVGVHGGARIADGRYAIPKEKGLKAGKYLVRINAPSALLSGNGAPGGAGKLPEETVSPKYNTNSQLNVEVGSEATQEFDFVVE
jgi:hypothetical protein